MEIKIFCPILYFYIEDNKDVPISSFLLQKLDASQLKNYLGEDFVKSIGSIEFDRCVDRYVAIGTLELSEAFSENDWQRDGSAIINTIGSQIEEFVRCLWYITDNSVQIGDIYAQLNLSDGFKYIRCSTGKTFCKSNGAEEAMTFSYSDISLATKASREFAAIHIHEDKTKQSAPKEKEAKLYSSDNLHTLARGFDEGNYNNHSRLQRAMMFLEDARLANFLPFKLAMYMSCFECIMSTDGEEISHKISERTSLFVASDNDEKHSIYKVLKICYGIRSKLIHGAVLEKDGSETTKITKHSQDIDTILRRVINKIVHEKSDVFLAKDTGVMELYFKELLFGAKKISN